MTDLTGGFELAHSIAYLETAFEEARAGVAATAPFSDGVMPTFVDPTMAPEGKHVVSLFTQWCPAEWADDRHADELDAYADRVIAGYDELAPGFEDSVLHRQVLGPHEMQDEWGLVGGNIFHGELSAEQLFHMRPAPGYADYRTPDPRALPMLERHARGRWRLRHPRLQLRPRDREGRPAGHPPPHVEVNEVTEVPRTPPGERLVQVLLRQLVPEVSVLPAHGRGRVHELGPLQPHADPDATTTTIKPSTGTCSRRSRSGMSRSSGRWRSRGPTPGRFTQLLTPRDLSHVCGRPVQVRHSSAPPTAGS